MVVGREGPMPFMASGGQDGLGLMADGLMVIVVPLPGIFLARVVEGTKKVNDRYADAKDGEGDVDSLKGNHDRIRV